MAGTEEGIVMVEAGAQQVSEAEVLGAIEFGHECCKKIAAGIRELMKLAGKTKREFIPHALDQALYSQIEKDVPRRTDRRPEHRRNTKSWKATALIAALKKRVVEALPEEQQRRRPASASTALKERIFRDEMLKNHRRPDGRAFDEVRKITIETGVLPRTHGSALFTRGETQALVTVTLGTKDDEQRIELLEPGEAIKRFMLHYNFPPFSVGEIGFMRGPGRREIGHGALAERSLTALIPGEDKFPYTMRVVSDILESNGSSSQATVCGASLALMDAGVPLTAHVGGIAMGLVMEGNDYAILTDIAGAEDHYGDMDFKVAGTRDGITGLQMDIKVAERHGRHHEGSAGTGAPRPPAHPRQDVRGDARPPRRPSASTRRESTRCRFRPIRSATSSDQAAKSSAASSSRPASRSTSKTTARFTWRQRR